jgi:hypothetical protein
MYTNLAHQIRDLYRRSGAPERFKAQAIKFLEWFDEDRREYAPENLQQTHPEWVKWEQRRKELCDRIKDNTKQINKLPPEPETNKEELENLQNENYKIAEELRNHMKNKPTFDQWDPFGALNSTHPQVRRSHLSAYLYGDVKEKQLLDPEKGLCLQYVRLIIFHNKALRGDATVRPIAQGILSDDIVNYTWSKITSDWPNWKGTIENAICDVEADLALFEPKCSHSDDYSSVIWYGENYTFNAAQARCVKMLWIEWKKSPGSGLREKTVGEKIGSESNNYRLVHTFRQNKKMHPAWGTMIHSRGDGSFYLDKPEKKLKTTQ